MKFLKQASRIIPAVIIGYFAVEFFNIESMLLRILFYFGIYIAVSMIIEPIWNMIEKKKEK